MRNDNVEVTRISSLGIWLRAHNKKFFLSYHDFPRFKNKPLLAVLHVEEPAPGNFYWPKIELTITAAAINSNATH
jgi:hypothetical protein